jgi:hypothetical protein
MKQLKIAQESLRCKFTNIKTFFTKSNYCMDFEMSCLKMLN